MRSANKNFRCPNCGQTDVDKVRPVAMHAKLGTEDEGGVLYIKAECLDCKFVWASANPALFERVRKERTFA